MNHFAHRALAFFILMGLPFLICEPGWGQKEEPAPFEIRLPDEIRSEQVQATYLLTGPFGTRADYLKAEPETNAYQIGTSVNHQAADGLAIILYAPGCQIVTITARPLSESERTADVTCRDLPTITLNGRVEMPESLRGHPYEVEIIYMAYWAHGFFEIQDGTVTTFRLARVKLDDSGTLQVILPNFAKDAVTESFHRNAGLRFIVREPDTNSIVSFLTPVNVQAKNSVSDLPIKSKYPNEVIFKPRAESPQNQVTGPAEKDVR